MKIGAIVMAVFMTLFGLVFVVAGSAVIVLGFTAENAEEMPWYIVLPFGGVFIAAGSFVIWQALRLPGNQARAEREKELYAAEPWKRVKVWRTPRIGEDSRELAWFFWAFALFWNFISWTVIGLGWEEMLQQAEEEPAMFTILLFPLVGIGLLIAAIRFTIQRRKFPPSAITLSSMPVQLGGLLDGRLELPDSLREAERIRVRLTCSRITRSGKNTHTTLLWQDEQERSAMEITSDGYHAILPVRIRIPRDAQESTVGESPQIMWQMNVSASVPGVDYSASFSIPVFGTASSQERTDDTERTPSLTLHPDDQTGAPAQRTVTMEMGFDGGMMWDFRPARVPGPAVGITAFALVWGAVTWFLITAEDVPGMFGLVFGFFEVLLLWGVYDMWFTRMTVTVRDGTITRRSGPLVTIRYIRFTRDEIDTFKVRSGMSAGSTAYHDILLMTKSGKKVRLGSYLRSAREAEAIVGEIKNAMGWRDEQ